MQYIYSLSHLVLTLNSHACVHSMRPTYIYIFEVEAITIALCSRINAKIVSCKNPDALADLGTNWVKKKMKYEPTLEGCVVFN